MKRRWHRIDLKISERQITILADLETGWGQAFERVQQGRHWIVIGACDVHATVLPLDESDAHTRIARARLEFDRAQDPGRSILHLAPLRFRASSLTRENSS